MKRCFDVLLTIVFLFLMLPIIFITALLVRFFLGKPILFAQERPGLRGKSFVMYKFRTMTDECDGNNELLPDSVRLSAFGLFLRSTSLDEIPGLWNVLRGEMSLVGPRPLLLEYLPNYSKEQARRHNVRPGITGWAQINGRNSISWEEKFILDVWYVDNQSLKLDCLILLLTIKKVFFRESISAKGEVTMSKFTNSKP